MKISTKQFLKLISGMTDSKPEMVLGEWETLLKSVRDLKPGETVEMNGLGVFKNVDGQINFDPDEELANEVNFEYSGQEPIVIEVGESGNDSPIGMSSANLDDTDELDEADADAGYEEDDLEFFKKGNSSKPLFPDVDNNASKKDTSDEQADEGDTIDDVFGIDDAQKGDDNDDDDIEPRIHKIPPYNPDERPENAINSNSGVKFIYRPDTGSEDKEAGEETSGTEAEGTSDLKEETPKDEASQSEKSPIEENQEPVSANSDADSKNEEKKPVIPDVEIDEMVLAELKAEEEAAKAEAEAEALARKKEKAKEKQEKAKQLKDFNVYIAPKRTKSRPHPREVARYTGIGIVSLIVISVFVWFFMDQFGSAGEAQEFASPAVQTDQPATGVPPAAGETEIIEEITPEDATRPAPADQTDEPSQPAPTGGITPPADPAPQPEPQTTAAESRETSPAAETSPSSGSYGLRGDIINVSGPSYGIVVFSFSNLENAERNEEVLRSMGYRTKIIRVQQNAETRYRVSVGQFESVEIATEAGQRLPEPYSNSFFIGRFTP